jgi:phosphopentomutase
MKQDFNGLCFANLVDFDMEFGHRRDVKGYGKAIEDFDAYVTKFKDLLNEDDMYYEQMMQHLMQNKTNLIDHAIDKDGNLGAIVF